MWFRAVESNTNINVASLKKKTKLIFKRLNASQYFRSFVFICINVFIFYVLINVSMYPLIHSFFHSFIYLFVSLLSYSVFTIPLMSHLRLRLGFVHPLQDVALQQCLPLSSVCCFPNPGGCLLLCYVVLPSSALSSSCSLPSPWLPLCTAFGPPIVLHSCYMTGPFPHVSVCIL